MIRRGASDSKTSRLARRSGGRRAGAAANGTPGARTWRPAVTATLAAISLAALIAVPASVVTSAAHPKPAAAVSLGNSACGSLSITPSTGVTGGYTYNGTTVNPTQLTLGFDWLGTTGNANCTVNQNSNGAGCLPWYQLGSGTCPAGYWLLGLFCSTQAQSALASGPSAAESYCDMNNIMVFTDDSSGPNNPGPGTSYNTCSTVVTLAGIIGAALPGTLYCITDGGTHGWSENWPTGSQTGTATGPAEETSSNTPFSPATTSATCPPSQADIAAGAIPDTCVVLLIEVDITDTCVVGICVPSSASQIATNAKNYMATTFTYQQTTPAQTTVSPTLTVTGDTINLTGSGWGPAVGLSSAAGTLTGQICGLGGVATTCSANSTVTLTEATNGSGTLAGAAVVGSDIGTQCVTYSCFVSITSTQTQVENGWIGPQTFTSQGFHILGPPAASLSTTAPIVGSTLTVSGSNFDPAGGPVTWYLKNTTTGVTYPSATCAVPGQPQPQGTSVSSTVSATGTFSASILLNLCIVPAYAGNSMVVVATQTGAAGQTLSATSAGTTLSASISESEDTPNFDQAVLAQQPLGYWTLGDKTGSTTAADSSGNFNTGTYHGTVTPAQPGPLAGPSPPTATSFDGSTGYISTAQEYVDPTTYTIGVWFKTTAAQGVLMAFNNTDSPTPTTYDRMLYINTAGDLSFGVYNGATNVVTTTTPVDNGAWHLAVASFTGGTMTLSVDNAPVGTITGITNPQNFNGWWVLGASNVGGWPNAPASGYFNGTLADAFVTPGVLSRSIIATLWGFSSVAQPVAGSFDSIYRQGVINLGATGAWPLSESSGAAVNDVTGSGNTGAYVGGATFGAAGPMSANGNLDTSVTLNGSSSLANVPQPLPGASASGTVAVWFKTTATGVPLVDAQNCSAPCAATASAPLLWVGANGDLYGTLGQAAGSALASGVPVADGNWHLAVVTASAAGTALYVDGVQVASNASTPNLTGLTELVLGSFDQTATAWPGLATGTSLYLNGSLADAAVFPSALADAQVAMLYALALTAYQGANVTMTPVTLNGAAGHTSIGMLEPISVANQAPTLTGWSMTATFTSPFQNATPSGPASDNQIPVSDLSYAPTVVQPGGATYQSLSTSGATPTAQGSFQPFALNTPATLCAAAGNGVAGSVAGGYANCGAVLQMTVPGTVAAGTYSATLQITIS